MRFENTCETVCADRPGPEWNPWDSSRPCRGRQRP